MRWLLRLTKRFGKTDDWPATFKQSTFSREFLILKIERFLENNKALYTKEMIIEMQRALRKKEVRTKEEELPIEVFRMLLNRVQKIPWGIKCANQWVLLISLLSNLVEMRLNDELEKIPIKKIFDLCDGIYKGKLLNGITRLFLLRKMLSSEEVEVMHLETLKEQTLISYKMYVWHCYLSFSNPSLKEMMKICNAHAKALYPTEKDEMGFQDYCQLLSTFNYFCNLITVRSTISIKPTNELLWSQILNELSLDPFVECWALRDELLNTPLSEISAMAIEVLDAMEPSLLPRNPQWNSPSLYKGFIFFTSKIRFLYCTNLEGIEDAGVDRMRKMQHQLKLWVGENLFPLISRLFRGKALLLPLDFVAILIERHNRLFPYLKEEAKKKLSIESDKELKRENLFVLSIISQLFQLRINEAKNNDGQLFLESLVNIFENLTYGFSHHILESIGDEAEIGSRALLAIGHIFEEHLVRRINLNRNCFNRIETKTIGLLIQGFSFVQRNGDKNYQYHPLLGEALRKFILEYELEPKQLRGIFMFAINSSLFNTSNHCQKLRFHMERTLTPELKSIFLKECIFHYSINECYCRQNLMRLSIENKIKNDKSKLKNEEEKLKIEKEIN